MNEDNDAMLYVGDLSQQTRLCTVKNWAEVGEEFEKGRKVRNPSRSNARYHLTKPIKAENLKEAFDVYEIERLAKQKGEKVSNVQLAKAIGLEVKQKNTDEQAEDYAYKNELLNTKVWRRKKIAKDAIANVVNGTFV